MNGYRRVVLFWNSELDGMEWYLDLRWAPELGMEGIGESPGRDPGKLDNYNRAINVYVLKHDDGFTGIVPLARGVDTAPLKMEVEAPDLHMIGRSFAAIANNIDDSLVEITAMNSPSMEVMPFALTKDGVDALVYGIQCLN